MAKIPYGEAVMERLHALADSWEQEANRLGAKNHSRVSARQDTLADCCRALRIALRERASLSDDMHRCSGCGHRWPGGAPQPHEWSGAKLCGDCWRKTQPLLHGSAALSDETLRELTRVVVDWYNSSEPEEEMWNRARAVLARHQAEK